MADGIPRETGEDEGADPFEECERRGERGDAAEVVGPEQARHGGGQPIEDRQQRRQQHDGDRQRPGEFVGVDQNRTAHPPQPADEIAEAEPPADGEGGPQAAQQPRRAFDGGAVEQPDQDRKGDEADREEIERRQREHGNRAGQKRRKRAPPTPQQYESAGKAFQMAARLKRIRGIDLAAASDGSKS